MRRQAVQRPIGYSPLRSRATADPEPGQTGRVQRQVNTAQKAVLDWLAIGSPQPPPAPGYKQSALALETRGLATIRRVHGVWTATLTEAGIYYHKHGRYPPDPDDDNPLTKQEHSRSSPSTRTHDRSTSRQARKTRGNLRPKPEFMVDSPKGIRAQGLKPRGDALRSHDDLDPWDERILVSVKEAAWLLSVDESEIRRAVKEGDLQRVFIGSGTTRYRIVYGSLLAWVNDLPRESYANTWWRRGW